MERPSTPLGKVDDRPIISLDIQPTAPARGLREGDADLEGVNLLPYLTGENKESPHTALCWRYGTKHAVRMATGNSPTKATARSRTISSTTSPKSPPCRQ